MTNGKWQYRWGPGDDEVETWYGSDAEEITVKDIVLADEFGEPIEHEIQVWDLLTNDVRNAGLRTTIVPGIPYLSCTILAPTSAAGCLVCPAEGAR